MVNELSADYVVVSDGGAPPLVADRLARAGHDVLVLARPETSGSPSDTLSRVPGPAEGAWDDLARVVSDTSWTLAALRPLLDSLAGPRTPAPPPRWQTQAIDRLAGRLAAEAGGALEVIRRLLRDEPLLLGDALRRAALDPDGALRAVLRDRARPDSWRAAPGAEEGIFPFTERHSPPGPAARGDLRSLPDGRLRVEAGACAVRLLLEGRHAFGVEYVQEGAGEPEGDRSTAWARREVILAAGPLDSPRLLLLSGIGPPGQLLARGIPCQVALTGVGQNLRGRYCLDLCLPQGHEPAPPAPTGLLVARRSRPGLPRPDLFLIARERPPALEGSSEGPPSPLWSIVKEPSWDRTGWVRLRSSDPRVEPSVMFRQPPPCRAGHDPDDADREAVYQGVEMAREIVRRSSGREMLVLPSGVGLDEDELVRASIRRDGWGHHLCGSCALGPRGKPDSVLDGQLRVHGVHGLRVADASAFPHLPSPFPASAVDLAGARVAEAILAGCVALPWPG